MELRSKIKYEGRQEGEIRADIVLVPYLLCSNGTSQDSLRKASWGVTEGSEYGCMTILLPKERQVRVNKEFLSRLGRHEGTHLLGLNMHHDESRVRGYTEPPDCNMYWRCSGTDTCDKCMDALKSYWKAPRGL